MSNETVNVEFHMSKAKIYDLLLDLKSVNEPYASTAFVIALIELVLDDR